MKFSITKRAKELECRRLKAGTYFNGGKSNVWIAKHFQVSTVAVWKWRLAWNRKGSDGLKSKGHCGVKGKLSKEDVKEIDKLLLKGAEKNGFSSPLWTLERVGEVIKRHTGVSFYSGHVWKVLRSMGWTNQKPVRRARERNESAIQTWFKETWPALQKKGF